MSIATMSGYPDQRQEVWIALDEQERLVELLESIAKSQRRAVEEGASADLLRLLARRSELLEQFASLSQHLSTLSRSVPLGEDERPACRRRLDAIRVRLGQLLDQDADDQDRLKRDRDALEGEVRGLGDARRAHHAYGRPSGSPRPRFTDGKG